MKIQTSDGFKRIDCIDRGDMILTNDGYQPVALIDICRYPYELINNNIIWLIHTFQKVLIKKFCKDHHHK